MRSVCHKEEVLSVSLEGLAVSQVSLFSFLGTNVLTNSVTAAQYPG